MKMLGSKAFGRLENKFKYIGKEKQDKEFADGSGLEWMDFGARMLDGQIGRWMATDPAADQRSFLSPYNAMSNDPVNRIDPDGALDGWVEHGGKMEYDSRVTSSATASYYYGEGAIYRETGYGYPSTSGGKNVNIVLGENGAFTSNGNPLKSPDAAPQLNATSNIGSYWSEFGGGVKGRFAGLLNDAKYGPGGLDPTMGLVSGLLFDPSGTIKGLGKSIFNISLVGLIYNAINNPRDFGSGLFDAGAFLLFKKISSASAVGSAGETALNAAKGGMTDLQLVTRAAQKAETAIGGSGRFAGTAKHTYANDLLSRYQSIYGSRGLEFNQYFNNNALYGSGNRGFLDVINRQTMTIYDYKFGNAVMGNSQFMKYSNNFPGYSIQVIKP
jgi:RHS repeat-associated protein